MEDYINPINFTLWKYALYLLVVDHLLTSKYEERKVSVEAMDEIKE